MTDPLCRWCGKTLADHSIDGPLARMPCTGRRSGFRAREPIPVAPVAELAIFGKAMMLKHTGLHHAMVGPFSCTVMPAVGSNQGRWWWVIETRPKLGEITSDYVETPEAAVKAIEKALADVETAIREARTA